MKNLIKKLVLKLESYCEKNNRFIVINGTGSDTDPYLIRYFLLRTKYLSIYIHRFMRSDADDPHDHPFDFVSYVVDGSYTELSYKKAVTNISSNILSFHESSNVRDSGSLAFRKAETVHQVLIDGKYNVDNKKEAPLTVIFRGPMRREWGFWKKSPNPAFRGWYKFQEWYKYLGVEKEGNRE